MSNIPPIVGNMAPVTRAEFEQVCNGFVAMNSQLLNVVAGVTAALEELRQQIDELVIDEAGTPDAQLRALAASKITHKLDYQLRQLAVIASGRDPATRQQRRNHPKKN